MNDYTPNTDEVLASAVWGAFPHPDEVIRWMKEERAKAWDEGYAKGAESERLSFGRKVSYERKCNPYREGVE